MEPRGARPSSSSAPPDASDGTEPFRLAIPQHVLHISDSHQLTIPNPLLLGPLKLKSSSPPAPPSLLAARQALSNDDAISRRKRIANFQKPCEFCGESLHLSPEVRRGPNGPNTLCNKCGLKYAKESKKMTVRQRMSINYLTTGDNKRSTTEEDAPESPEAMTDSGTKRTKSSST